jgi:phosphatidylglycerol:prolipoprotein diacylglycerol transferase
MSASLLHLYGPISIQWYGSCILCALLIFLRALKKDKTVQQIIPFSVLIDALCVGIICAIVGGRLLYLFENSRNFQTLFECIAIWDGGFSILGSLITTTLVVPLYVYYKKIAVIKLMDRVAVYAPLLQGISRIGCYFAGCCYGTQTTLFWAIKDPTHSIMVHPTPLYSSAALLIIFLLLFFLLQHRTHYDGQLFALYVCLVSAERFIVDFWRAERTFSNGFLPFLSFNQVIACMLAIIAISAFIVIPKVRTNESF